MSLDDSCTMSHFRLLKDINLIWRINQYWSFKSGFEMIYVDGVALAPENVNTEPPFGGTRFPAMNNNGDVFLHGITLGLEYMW